MARNGEPEVRFEDERKRSRHPVVYLAGRDESDRVSILLEDFVGEWVTIELGEYWVASYFVVEVDGEPVVGEMHLEPLPQEPGRPFKLPPGGLKTAFLRELTTTGYSPAAAVRAYRFLREDELGEWPEMWTEEWAERERRMAEFLRSMAPQAGKRIRWTPELKASLAGLADMAKHDERVGRDYGGATSRWIADQFREDGYDVTDANVRAQLTSLRRDEPRFLEADDRLTDYAREVLEGMYARAITTA